MNRYLLEAVLEVESDDVLCEWVPSRGAFVSQLSRTCDSLDRRFLHIILTAPISVLEARKQERDGDTDLGPGVNEEPDQESRYECYLFDTDQMETCVITEKICGWILDIRRRDTTD